MGTWLSMNPEAVTLGAAADLLGCCTCCVQYSQSTCAYQTVYHLFPHCLSSLLCPLLPPVIATQAK